MTAEWACRARPRRQLAGEAMKRVYVVGTADTKGEELAYLAERVREAGGDAADRRCRDTRAAIAVGRDGARGGGASIPSGADAALGTDDRGAAVAAMGEAFARFIASRDDIGGVVGIGGGGGTSIITAGMRALPVGLPKLMVSTLASGDVRAYVGVSDIAMMHSVTDIAGLNRISRAVLAQRRPRHRRHGARAGRGRRDGKPAIGLTMFGVTTPAVTQVAELLARRLRLPRLPRHRNRRPRHGEAGRQRPCWSASSTSPPPRSATSCSAACCSAGPDRLGAIARTGVPYVGSVGALDMVNFRAPRDGAGEIPRPQPLPAQSAGHADAHDAGGEPQHRRLDRRAAQSLRRRRCAS